MKKTLLLALALIAVGCSEPEPRNLDELITQGAPLSGDGLFLDRETMRPYSGPIFAFHLFDNTRIRLKGNLKDGKTDGPFEEYLHDGQLRYRGTQKEGKWNGPFEEYDENGQLQRQGIFDMGDPCGMWIADGESGAFDPC